MKKIVSIIITVFVCSFCHAQDTSIVKYLPLKVGNVWVYYFQGSCYQSGTGQGSGRDKYVIDGSFQLNGNTYFTLQHFHKQETGSWIGVPVRIFGSLSALRVDSLSGNVYALNGCGGNVNSLGDSLRSQRADTFSVCQEYFSKVACTDTAAYSVFGTVLPSKSFSNCFFEAGFLERFAKTIGVTFFGYGAPSCSSQSQLIGCVIDGVAYGDTLFPMGVNQVSTEIPNLFSLYQNYPNPFNPSTKIKFDIPAGNGRDRSVMLIIYNSLGQQVAELVNEQLQPGTYEVDWNAADMPSGVYYYTLTAGELSQTKKMVLIK